MRPLCDETVRLWNTKVPVLQTHIWDAIGEGALLHRRVHASSQTTNVVILPRAHVWLCKTVLRSKRVICDIDIDLNIKSINVAVHVGCPVADLRDAWAVSDLFGVR